MVIELTILNLVIVMLVGFFFGIGFHVAGYLFGWLPRRS